MQHHCSTFGGSPDGRHIFATFYHPRSHSPPRDHCGEFEEHIGMSMIRAVVILGFFGGEGGCFGLFLGWDYTGLDLKIRMSQAKLAASTYP